jgi:hypothetical protein
MKARQRLSCRMAAERLPTVPGMAGTRRVLMSLASPARAGRLLWAVVVPCRGWVLAVPQADPLVVTTGPPPKQRRSPARTLPAVASSSMETVAVRDRSRHRKGVKFPKPHSPTNSEHLLSLDRGLFRRLLGRGCCRQTSHRARWTTSGLDHTQPSSWSRMVPLHDLIGAVAGSP